jgi:hypothetical protein
MKIWRAHLIVFGIALAARFAAAQAAPTQGGGAPQAGAPAPAPGGAQPVHPPAAPGGAVAPGGPNAQLVDGQQPQGTKARGYPPPYFPPQGGALQQPPGFGGAAVGTPGAGGRMGPPPSESGETPDDDLGHRGQMNFRAEFLTGYRMLYRYQPSPRCAPFDNAKSAADQQKFCGYGSAPAVGLAVGFSLVDFFEPFAFVRLGLANEATQTNQGRLMQVGVGARLYTMATSRFKIAFVPWLGIDATTGPLETIGSGPPGTPGYDDALAKVQPGSYKTDVLAHFGIAPQYDFTRGFGMYVSGGLTFQMVRYLGASADVAIGIQARAP